MCCHWGGLPRLRLPSPSPSPPPLFFLPDLPPYRSVPSILGAAEGVLSLGGLPRLHQPLVAMKAKGGHVEHVGGG